MLSKQAGPLGERVTAQQSDSTVDRDPIRTFRQLDCPTSIAMRFRKCRLVPAVIGVFVKCEYGEHYHAGSK
jgi:hypothetical protein